jgi:hypothetical protein
LKWIRLFTVGVVLLTGSFLLFVVRWLANVPGWFTWMLGSVFAVGLLVFLVGLTGIVLGGRRGAEAGRQDAAR